MKPPNEEELKEPTVDELKEMLPDLERRYKDMLERMKTLALACLHEYPQDERMLACNALVGVGLGGLAAALDMSDEDEDAFQAELQSVIFKWTKRGVMQNQERFAGGLPDPMKRPEGS